MAKWDEPSDETLKQIEEVLVAVGLDNLINSKIIANNDQPKHVITLKKTTPVIKYAFNYDLLIIVNEEIFDELPPLQRRLCIEESLAGTYYNSEADKLVVGTKDVNTYSGFLDKYDFEKYQVLAESIKSLYDNKKNKDNLEG